MYKEVPFRISCRPHIQLGDGVKQIEEQARAATFAEVQAHAYTQLPMLLKEHIGDDNGNVTERNKIAKALVNGMTDSVEEHFDLTPVIEPAAMQQKLTTDTTRTAI